MSLADFEKVAVLGAGAFGQVLLVRQGPKYYALKVLSKQHLLQTGLQVHDMWCRSSPCTRPTPSNLIQHPP